jgi:NAD(P)H-hydrate epimerase
MVIDADGLNWLAQSPDILSSGAQTILTPHPGEMARLLGSDVATIQSDRVGAVSKAVDKFHQTVVLKGGSTITSAPDSTFYFNANGNSGLATAGTGDVLTGIIGGLLGQKVGSLHAAALGVYLHSLAGDIASHEIGAIGYTASDLSRFIPKARRAIQEE